jgi:hypothetical protein
MSVSLLPDVASGEPRAAVLGDDAPWRAGELVRVGVVSAAGLIGVAVAWYGASAHADWPDTLPWASLGTGALTVALLGLVAWLMAALRRVRNLRREVMPRLKAAVSTPSITSPARTAPGADFVTAGGMTRFHHPGCPLATGKPVRPLTIEDARSATLKPCGVCVR